MAMIFPGRPGAVSRAIFLSSLLFLFLLPGCSGEKPEVEPTVPGGIIGELQSESSITTDVNARAPAFAREDLQGNLVRSQDFIGNRVLLLDFWSVFCTSCLQEIPFLQELYGTYHDKGLEIVSVNTDFFPRSRIESFMKKTGIALPFPLVFDRDQSLSKLFQVEALPVTVLIDSSGWIRMVHLGYRPKDRKMIESRVRKACSKIKETVVTLQPVEGRTAYAPPGKGPSLLEPGSPVPEFETSDGSGKVSSFSSLRQGRPAVIFFWSLFCQPCREEFPRLTGLSERFPGEDLAVFAVNIDTEKLRPAAARFTGKMGAGFVSLFDVNSTPSTNAIAEIFGVHFTPSLVVVAADGTVRFSAAGELLSEDLDREVSELFEDP
jgi:thiol-disulfide isomerase/thioredoxin